MPYETHETSKNTGFFTLAPSVMNIFVARLCVKILREILRLAVQSRNYYSIFFAKIFALGQWNYKIISLCFRFPPTRVTIGSR